MAMMEISIVPIGTGSTSLSRFVAEAVKAIEEEGLRYQVTPMATVVEGELERLLHAARLMHEAAIKAGAFRVITSIKIDDRRDRRSSMEDKIRSVMEKIG